MQRNDILHLNVSGKKYMINRKILLADPNSKLAKWFQLGATSGVQTDKSGNFFLDRDSKTFRHILAYLRFKNDKMAQSMALPSKPDELAKLIAECHAFSLIELMEIAHEMLKKYTEHEEQHYVTSYVQMTMHDFKLWKIDKERLVEIPKNEKDKKNISLKVETKKSKNKNKKKSQLKTEDFDEW